MSERYFVIIVRKNKHIFSQKVLFLVEGDSEERCLNAFDYIKPKLPFLDKESPFVYECFDLSDNENYLEFFTKYQNYIIYLKINHTPFYTFYLEDVFLPVCDFIYHERPMSIVHIQTRLAVIQDDQWMKKKDRIEKEIETSLAYKNLNFSVTETSTIFQMDKIETLPWKAIMEKNDLGIIFYESSLNTIISLCKELAKIATEKKRYIFAYFVDKTMNLYYISFHDNIEIIPFKQKEIIL